MCGRYTLTTSPDGLVNAFALEEAPRELKPRYNIAPGSDVAVVANRNGRQVEFFRWGLIPSWAKDPAIGHRMINARAETASEKPSFRSALRRRRCLILADGFYEWQGARAPKTPMYARLRGGEPFAFAGLWESWQPPDGTAIHSCAILTTRPNELMAPIHNRMPVILDAGSYDLWLDPAQRAASDFESMLVPFAADRMEVYEVSRAVNNPLYDHPNCVAAVAAD